MSPDSAAPAATAPGAPPLLLLDGIHKRFGQTQALAGATLRVEAGEIHALLGENGAGKSTLMRIAFGLVTSDAGTVQVDGVARRITSPLEARRLGIGMVHQHFTAIPTFSVLENVALWAGWPAHPRDNRARLARLMEATGIDLPPDVAAERLSAGLKQRLEVLKALASEARILLLDEPTSVLPPPETAGFLDLITGLRARGVSSVLITHKITEALETGDRVTVLRRGSVVHSGPVAGASEAMLAAAMLGEAMDRPSRPAPPAPGPVLATLTGVAVAQLEGTGSGLRGATLELRAGEVLGVAAVEGNGQRELLRAITGLAPVREGMLRAAGPTAFIPEDRTHEGLIADFSLTEHLVLVRGGAAPWVRRGWIDWPAARTRTAELMTAYGIRAAGPDAPAASLSGGNQQRMVIAGAAERSPRILVAEHPARGLDFRATAEVYERLKALARGGAAVVLHVPDLDELLQVADRLVVVADGLVVEVPPGASREQIGSMMLSRQRRAPTGEPA